MTTRPLYVGSIRTTNSTVAVLDGKT